MSPPRNCPQPRLGKLCGKDAIAAYVGIGVGGLLLLALLFAAIVYCMRTRVSAACVCGYVCVLY